MLFHFFLPRPLILWHFYYFLFHLWLRILLWARDEKSCTDWNMAAVQYLPCLLLLSSSDPMGMKNLRLFHGSLWKIPNWSFFEKGDITSELPHVAIMEFLFMWMDIFTRYWKNATAQLQCNKGKSFSHRLTVLWEI